MKVYCIRGFTGHYPVGTSAVVCAPNRLKAAKMLEKELRKEGLEQVIDPKQFKELGNKSEVLILNNGNY